MKKSVIWTLSVVITMATVVYQRMTGPTHSLRGSVKAAGETISFRLPRSHETSGDCEVSLAVKNTGITGFVEYQRYKTKDPWTILDLERKDGRLSALLPKQPAAGKLAYRVALSLEGMDVYLADGKAVVMRFRDPVPAAILIPHIIVMFLAILFSTRAGLAALHKNDRPRLFAFWTLMMLVLGGCILGPIVQKYAFGDWWTGFPLGYDLTDNKTLIATVIWIVALVAGRKGRNAARAWILGAAILMLAVYLIPHSLFGSELDYSKMIPRP